MKIVFASPSFWKSPTCRQLSLVLVLFGILQYLFSSFYVFYTFHVDNPQWCFAQNGFVLAGLAGKCSFPSLGQFRSKEILARRTCHSNQFSGSVCGKGTGECDWNPRFLSWFRQFRSDASSHPVSCRMQWQCRVSFRHQQKQKHNMWRAWTYHRVVPAMRGAGWMSRV